MRLTMIQRSVGYAILVTAIVALVGCDGKGKGTGPDAARDQNKPVASGGESPMEATDRVLKALGEGVVKADQLTTHFKKSIAPPTTEAEKQLGYSEAAAQAWLDGFRGMKFVTSENAKFGNAVVARGRAEAPNRREAFSLRQVGGASSSGPSETRSSYQIDWLHRSERMGTEIKPVADPDLAAAQDTVRNFLDILLGGDLRQAHALMTPAWKKSIAPPNPADTRDGYDYSPGFLTQTTRAWKRDFTGYSLPKADFTPDGGKSAATFTAQFSSGGETVPYVVQSVKDQTTGRWLIRDFSKQLP